MCSITYIAHIPQFFYFPAFGVFDGVAEHVVEDGLSEAIEFLELRILLVDDTRQQIQLRNNTGLLRKRRNGDNKLW